MRSFFATTVGIIVFFLLGVAAIFAALYGTQKAYLWYLYQKYPLTYKYDITYYATQHSIDPPLLAAVIYEESRFNTNSRSLKGALGLMQIIPETATYIAEKIEEEAPSEDALLDPSTNIRYGAYYLAYLLQHYDRVEYALAAYNAGEGNVALWLAEKEYRIPFEETKQFVARVLATREQYASLYTFTP